MGKITAVSGWKDTWGYTTEKPEGSGDGICEPREFWLPSRQSLAEIVSYRWASCTTLLPFSKRTHLILPPPRFSDTTEAGLLEGSAFAGKPQNGPWHAELFKLEVGRSSMASNYDDIYQR